jgi:peptidyl-dipeptidase Dcp
MKLTHLFITSLLVIMISCNKSTETSKENQNPLLMDFSSEYGVPPFDIIKNEHYTPAFIEAIKQHEAEILTITDNPEQANFDNTILAFDRSGKLLDRVSSIFFNVLSANSSDTLQTIAKEITPILTEHENNIMLNEALFNRIKSVYDQRHSIDLNESQIRVIEQYYKDFIRNGANLNNAGKEQLRKINNELSMLSLEFGDNVLAETNKNFKLIIEDPEKLSGLPENIKSIAAETAKMMDLEGKWVFQPTFASMIPFLQYSDQRELREELYEAYLLRGNNDNDFDNKLNVKNIAEKRAIKAKLLGFNTHADYVIDVNMAETPANVNQFLDKLWKSALPIAKKEVREMQRLIYDEGNRFKLEAWDWFYYAEKLRKQKYNLDENELKPYFQLENVRDGMFWVAGQLYGIQFKKLDNIPVYHPEVEVWEVTEKDGSLVGLLYTDYYTRESKRGGAWCTSFRDRVYLADGTRIEPLASIVTNFSKGNSDTPTLLSWDETTTMFHEFGHALHVLFSDGQYKRISGVVPRDYVELPSQVMENYAGEPEVLRTFAKHYKTGEIIPDTLIEKLNNSGHFNQGFMTVEYLAASILDMAYHCLESGEAIPNVNEFETNIMDSIRLIDEIYPRYRSTYFQHIFSGGYSAGYYVYIWAAVLDADAFQAFKESGNIFNPELASKFRQHCLAEVGESPAMEQYIKFRGQEPNENALLERRGLK